VTLSFTQPTRGRRVRRKCVSQNARDRHNPRCTRTVVAGTLAFTGHQGTNRVHFYGRLSAVKGLKIGHYSLAIIATNGAGQHTTSRPLSLTIVK
jgi:hypothetical protein